MKREELLARTRKHLWAAWTLSGEELASQAAETLMGLGMLVAEGEAAELVRLRRRVVELEQLLADAPVAVTLTEKVDAAADKLTRLLAPTQALRDDGEHYAVTHHSYRRGRDLPELGGAR